MGQASLARKGNALYVALALGLLLLLVPSSQAIADEEFCPTGEGAGQCAAPEGLSSLRGVAVDQENGRLYAVDRSNNRVDAFSEGGDFLFAFGWGVDTGAATLETCTEASGCQKGLAGSGAGQFEKPTKIAVDNDPTSPNHHFVYVVDQVSFRVELFNPNGAPGTPVAFIRSIGSKGEGPGQFLERISIAVGPGGILHVLDDISTELTKHRLQRFQTSGAQIVSPPPAECILLPEEGRAISLAVDSTGNSWVASAQPRAIRKYAPDCSPLLLAEESDEIEGGELAIDESDNLFAAQSELRDAASGSFRVIAAYNAAGEIQRRFGYGRIPLAPRLEGLAARNDGQDIFASVRQAGFLLKRLDLPPAPPPSPGPLPAPPSLEIKNLGSTKATLFAEVNPEGKATDVHFEYLTAAEFADQGGFEGSATKVTPTKPLGAEGFKLKATDAEIGCPDPATEAGEPGNDCLIPETTYRSRAVAANGDNLTGTGESSAEGPTFTTNASLEIGEVWASGVGTDTARLNGEVRPNSIPATGFFEYVDDTTFQADVKKAEEEGKTSEEAIDAGFSHATKAPAGAPLDFGAGAGFVTRGVAIYPLLSGTIYHYRLVGENPLIEEPVIGEAEELHTFSPPQTDSCSNNSSRIGAGSFLPDCRAYEMVSPLDKAGGDIRVPAAPQGQPAVLEQGSESGNRLAYGSVRSFGDAASAPFTSQYIARRIEGRAWETHSINPPRGRPIFGAKDQFDTEFKAFSANLCDAWLTTYAEPPLGPGAEAGYSNLYRRTDELCSADGKAHYEALAPLGEPEGMPPGPDFLPQLVDVSTDGKHALFTANGRLTEEGTKGPRQVYEHVRGAGLRFVCELPEGGGPVSGSCAGGSSTLAAQEGAGQRAISDDGQGIFWSVPGTAEGKIYLRIGGAQTSAISKTGEEESGTSKSWFWGASGDGSIAIFGTSPSADNADLYEFDVDTETTQLIAHGVRGVMGISEDAGRVYFASSKAIAGSGKNSVGDEAVEGAPNLYLHEAGEGDGSTDFIATLADADLGGAVSNVEYLKHTSRVTPDGAHAAFVSLAPLTGYDNKDAGSSQPTDQVYRYDADTDKLLCVSCNPSGARPEGSARIPPWQTGRQAARILSDDGARLYFESADELAPRDSNGQIDVYQWEAPGVGGCDEGDADFSLESGGCLELVSSGQSPLDSRFVDASTSGNDVFFATVASLLPQDFGLVDIYDARVGGGLPIPPVPPPPCEGDTCAAQVSAPEPATPASSGYVAPSQGKEAGPARKRCAKGSRRAKRKGKTRCVARRHKKHTKARRPAR
jgi:hypothetical protein